MHRKIAILFIILGLGAFLVGNDAKSISFIPPQSPSEDTVPPALPDDLTSDTWGIFNIETGEILYGKNTDTQREIASVTKLFTAYAVFESSEKNETFTITQSDIATEGRSGKLIAGETTTLYALLFPLLIESSNDSASAIERILGNAFAESHGTLRKKLSLSDTYIADASGLSRKNVSTVHDLALFFAHLSNTYPHSLDITTLKTYISADTGYINNNPLSADTQYRGGKHGYTETAGRTFVGAFDTDEATPKIGIVVLKSKDLVHDVESLRTFSESL